MTSFSAADKARALKRELMFRHRVYPRRIKAGLMTQQKADHEISVFEAMLEDYQNQVLADPVPGDGRLI